MRLGFKTKRNERLCSHSTANLKVSIVSYKPSNQICIVWAVATFAPLVAVVTMQTTVHADLNTFH